MSENNGTQQTNANAEEKKQPTKLVSAGKPQPAIPANLGGISELENIESKEEKKPDAATAGAENGEEKKDDGKEKTNDNAGNTGGSGDGKSADIQLTREKIKELFDFDGTPEELKAHLAKKGGSQQTSEKTEPTEEEKLAQEKVIEERIVKKFITNGGTYEQYAALKSLANLKPEDISLQEIKRELKEASFSDEEADALIKEHYFMLSDDEVAQYENETDREFAKRKREYGTKKLNASGSNWIEQAKSSLKELRDSITAEDLLAQKEKDFSSTVDGHFSKIERKLTFQLGEQEGKQIAPIDFEVTDADIVEVAETLKDKDKRQKFFFNEDGTTLNLTNVAEVLLKNKLLEKAVKLAYTTGVDRQVEEFEKVFPKNAGGVGLGAGAGANGKTGTGKLVSSGKPIVGIPQPK